jgi:hypothetical protein
MSNENIQDKVLRLLYTDPDMVTLIKDKYLTDEIWMFCIEREPSVFEEMKRPNEKV